MRYTNPLLLLLLLCLCPGMSGHILDGIQHRRDDDIGAAEEVFICLWTGAMSLNSVNV